MIKLFILTIMLFTVFSMNIPNKNYLTANEAPISNKTQETAIESDATKSPETKTPQTNSVSIKTPRTAEQAAQAKNEPNHAKSPSKNITMIYSIEDFHKK